MTITEATQRAEQARLRGDRDLRLTRAEYQGLMVSIAQARGYRPTTRQELFAVQLFRGLFIRIEDA